MNFSFRCLYPKRLSVLNRQRLFKDLESPNYGNIVGGTDGFDNGLRSIKSQEKALCIWLVREGTIELFSTRYGIDVAKSFENRISGPKRADLPVRSLREQR